jgi:2-polyprenyl-3-methyl-5-hydroxy-6-metoxy-1,4-benzoquinol methylase
VESAELIAILREVRERVRAQRPETSGGPAGIPVADLMGLVHARDSALGKVAAIGTVNPRSGGLANSVIQAWKRLVARVLDWHVREQVEFNRQVLACVDAAIEALNEDNRALVELGSRLAAAVDAAQENLRAAQESLGRDIQAAQDRLGRDIKAAQEGLGQEIQMVQESLGPEMADIRKHWAEWRTGWEHKLAQNEIQFLRSVADLQGAFQHRATLMDTSFRETVRAQHADFTAALERSAVEIQKRLWLEFERTIHAELRIIRQRAQVLAADGVGAGHPATHGQVARPVPASPDSAPLAIDLARFALCFRGSEEYVKAGQRQYVANFEECQNVLDIGCGRGEFLEIMREANIPAVGIDLSRESVAICRLKGLQAETADLFTYLAGLPEESLDGIFCAQVVEHLPPERLPEMIQLCAGRLMRNGVMVVETPNPECLAIFATHFYLDPTHARPVPHKLLAFYLEESGVGVIEVRKLAPAVESMPSLGLLPEAFRDAFFGGLDYAIIGKKL